MTCKKIKIYGSLSEVGGGILQKEYLYEVGTNHVKINHFDNPRTNNLIFSAEEITHEQTCFGDHDTN